jgi:hypothetical protein
MAVISFIVQASGVMFVSSLSPPTKLVQRLPIGLEPIQVKQQALRSRVWFLNAPTNIRLGWKILQRKPLYLIIKMREITFVKNVFTNCGLCYC